MLRRLRRVPVRARVLAAVGAGVLTATVLQVTGAAAAATRYEAESATLSQAAVASNHTGFSGTGFVDYTNVTGGSVEFTVNASAAGSATLAFRYANGTTVDRPMDIAVNGSTVATAVSFPATTNWDTWATKTVTAPVAIGTNKIRATATTANGGPNLDFLDFEVTTAPAFTDYQAESATLSQATVATNHTGFTGTGFVDYTNVTGSFVEFTVNAPAAGNYGLTFRYANGTASGAQTNRPMDIAVNGTVVAPNLAFNPTTDWDTWADQSVTVALTAGTNKVRASATTANGGPNLDRLRVSNPTDTEAPTPPGNFHPVADPTPFAVDVTWNPSTDNIGVVLYRVYNGGNVMAEVGGNVTTAHITLKPNTDYVLSAAAFDAAGNASQASNSYSFRSPPSNDTTPPSVPGNLHTTNIASSSISLAWNASTDDTGVAGYNVYRDGVKFATVPDLTATADSLQPDTQYSFTVEAFDGNGNTSAKAPAITAKTLPADNGGSGGDPSFDRDISTNVDLAWSVAFLPDKTALVTERDRFEILRFTLSGQKTVLGKITEARTTGGEGGLLGIAVSPTFTTDHFVYIYYTSDTDNRVARFTFENGTLGAREPIVTGINKNQFHNGGRIKFGPDGFLYIATGDAKNSNNAQNLNSLNGKILRVTPTGAPAPGNPFGTRVYSYGHRNVQGLAWDSAGRLWASELGENTFDELNLIQPGKNYGWPTCEGKCGNASFVDPVQVWDVASASPSGLEIVNDWIYMAAIRGGRLWVMQIQGSTTDTPRAFFNGRWGRLRDVVKTPDGGLWLTNTNNDKTGGSPNTLDNVIVRLKFTGTPFRLTTTAWASNGNIPTRYTCQQDGTAGQDISPPLTWGPGTAAAKSYAITLIDTANSNKHWVIWDIPASTLRLPEGLGSGFTVPQVSGAKQKAMGSGNTALMFFGPCPGGSSHKYEFRLYAIDTATLPGLSSSSTVAAVETAILAHDLALFTLSGNSAAHT